MPLNDDELVLISVKPFRDRDAMRGKAFAVAISFSWMDCLNGEINADASIGLPITLRNGRVVPHDLYIEALVDLFSRHSFGKLKFILAAELQWSNLMTARGLDPYDPKNELEKQRALGDLFRLEQAWVNKFLPVINRELAEKNVVIQHWRKAVEEQGCQAQKEIFEKLKQGDNIKRVYEKEVAAACRREHNKGRIITSESVRRYLDEETPVFMWQVSPSNPNQVCHFFYPSKVDFMVKVFNALEVGHGLWTDIKVEIQTKNDICMKNLNKDSVLSSDEGIGGTTLNELKIYIERLNQEEPQTVISQFGSSISFFPSSSTSLVSPSAISEQLPIQAEVLIQDVSEVLSQFQQGNFSPSQLEFLLNTLRQTHSELLRFLGDSQSPVRSGSPTISSFSA